MKSVWSWLGNASTNVWNWSTKAGGQALEFAWSLPGAAAEQARALAEKQAKEMGRTISETKRAASGLQRFAWESVSLTTWIILALSAAVLVTLLSKK